MRRARSGSIAGISTAAVKKTIMMSAGTVPLSGLAPGTVSQPSGQFTSTTRRPGLSPSLRASDESSSMRQEHVMFADTEAFSGFAVDDIAQAQEFYGQTLGL